MLAFIVAGILIAISFFFRESYESKRKEDALYQSEKARVEKEINEAKTFPQINKAKNDLHNFHFLFRNRHKEGEGKETLLYLYEKLSEKIV